MTDNFKEQIKSAMQVSIQVRLAGTLLSVLAWNRQQQRGLPRWLEEEIFETLKYARENSEVGS